MVLRRIWREVMRSYKVIAKKTDKCLQWIIVLALAAYVIKNLFVGVDNDETYGIVLGYRLATGDKLLLEMWEPHQTSAIFTAFIMKPFLWLRGGNITYLNLYLRVAYFVIHGFISYAVYCTFKFMCADGEKKSAKWVGIIFFVSVPKCIFIPEYSNLHIWFFTLLSLSLVWIYSEQSPAYGKKVILLLSGAFLACDVLAYPSMVLLYPFCILLMWMKRRNTFWKEAVLFTLPCVIGAVALLGYIFSYMSVEQIYQVIPYILGDGSHSVPVKEKWYDVFVSVGRILKFFAGAAAIAGVGTLGYGAWYKRKKGEQKSKKALWNLFAVLMFVMLIVQQFYFWFTSEYNASYPHAIYVFLCLTGVYYCGKTERKEKTGLFLIGLSFVSYIGTILMSNFEPIHLIPYLIVGALWGLLYWNHYLSEQGQNGRKIFRMLCAFLAFSNIFGYCYLMIGGVRVHAPIFEVGGYNRDGLRKGILAEYMSAYCYNMNGELWSEAIPEGSNVLFVGKNPLFYMQGECVIASGSTISTPTYDESLLAYWELNPDRYPDVVVFDSMWGNIDMVEEDSFIMQWVLNDFGATEVLEYPYMTVFRK